MDKLTALTPLGDVTARVDTIGGLEIREVVDQAMASVAARLGQADLTKETTAAKLGLVLPDVGLSSQAAPFTAFWMGPDQWMISAEHDSHELLASEVKLALGPCASVVEQTDGWCRFDITGVAVCDLFERLCNAPLRQMANGAVTRSSVEHVGAFVWRLTEERVAVIAPRSSANSLHHALIAAATSIA
ncbi:sarcosine oxidase subunit gamma [Aliiroseovarius lamellibrachiae]|uniref:sarcosine oxidase subunit gamma n=1 Tax=Aliiroseovarius lamellibrachiae TaxID=1924933 RepID=UPI001BE01B40|nr:sarcosine oxidase subunit gamma [Aliiroseovarius lamellibrachiae]